MTHTVKSFDEPDETRKFANGAGQLDIVSFADRSFGRATFQPGWEWKNDVRPIVGGDSCQVHHVDYVLSGTMHITLNDGTEINVKAGDLMDIPPGHNAEVTGDQPFVAITLIGEGSETEYAKPKG